MTEQADTGVGPRNEAVMDNQATADARADRDHGEVLHVAPVTEPVLGLHQSRQIVGDGGRASQERSQQIAEVDVAPAEERCSPDA